jgi:hypothetical protein
MRRRGGPRQCLCAFKSPATAAKRTPATRKLHTFANTSCMLGAARRSENANARPCRIARGMMVDLTGCWRTPASLPRGLSSPDDHGGPDGKG